MKPNFYVQDTKVYDPQGNEIPEDENGIVIVEVDGVFKPYVRSILVRWLANNPDIPQAKIPKAKRIPSQFEAMQAMQEQPKKRTREKKTKPLKEKRGRGRPKVVREDPAPEPKEKRLAGRPRIRPRDESGKLIKPPKKQAGRKRIYPRNEQGVRLDKLPKGTPKGVGSKSVVCVNTGVVYESMCLASKELGINRACIRNCAEGKWKETKGYSFKFL